MPFLIANIREARQHSISQNNFPQISHILFHSHLINSSFPIIRKIPKCPKYSCPLSKYPYLKLAPFTVSYPPKLDLVAQSDAHPTGIQEAAGLILQSSNILWWRLVIKIISTAILFLPLIQVRQLSAAGKRM